MFISMLEVDGLSGSCASVSLKIIRDLWQYELSDDNFLPRMMGRSDVLHEERFDDDYTNKLQLAMQPSPC